MKALLIIVSATLLVGGCVRNLVQQPAVGAGAATSAATMAYAQSATSIDMFEIEAARLAMQRAHSPAVRQFAQAMSNDHGQISTLLAQNLQAQAIMTGGSTLLPQHQGLLAQLQSATPGQFDNAYRNITAMSHMQAWDLHQRYAAAGDNPALRHFAQSSLPLVQNHLAQAQSLVIDAPPAFRAPSARRAGERG